MPGHPIANFLSFQTWFSLMSSSTFADTLLDPVRGPSYEPKDASLAKAADFEGLGVTDMWQYLGKYHPKRIEEFGNAMTALGSVGVSGLLSGESPCLTLSLFHVISLTNSFFLLLRLPLGLPSKRFDSSRRWRR